MRFSSVVGVRIFSASGQGLRTTAPVTGAPFTASIWIKPTGATENGVAWFLGDASSGSNRWFLQMRVLGGNFLRMFVENGAQIDELTSNQWTLDAWNHALFIEASNSDHAAVLNNDWANRATSATTTTPPGTDRMAVGRADDSTPSSSLNGAAAGLGVWNIALGQAEIAALWNGGVGRDPREVRGESLVSYFLLDDFGNWVDVIGGLRMTEISGPLLPAPNPPYMQRRPQLIAKAPVAVGGRIMSSLAGAGGLVGPGGIAGKGGGLAA